MRVTPSTLTTKPNPNAHGRVSLLRNSIARVAIGAHQYTRIHTFTQLLAALRWRSAVIQRSSRVHPAFALCSFSVPHFAIHSCHSVVKRRARHFDCQFRMDFCPIRHFQGMRNCRSISLPETARNVQCALSRERCWQRALQCARQCTPQCALRCPALQPGTAAMPATSSEIRYRFLFCSQR